MPSLFDFSTEIRNLNKGEKFAEALGYFKAHKGDFTTDQIASNEYIISELLSALRHTGNYDSAFKFLEIYKIKIDQNTKERISTGYGWLLYSKLKSENQIDENNQVESAMFDDDEIGPSTVHHYEKTDIIKQIESFLPLILKIDNDYAYSVLSMLFTSVVKAEKKKPNANWKIVNDICDIIPHDRLHTDCRTIQVQRKGQLKPMELASDKENWFAYKSKALMKLGMFKECYDVSTEALNMFETFHYSNDVWFARRIALSKKNMGNSADAIIELEQVLKRKNEWFIQKELATLYRENGDTEKAFRYAIAAINNFGDLEYKVDLLYLLGELLNEKGEPELAFKHYSLSSVIRQKEEWNIPEKLKSALTQFDKPSITVNEFQSLKSDLKKYWESLNSDNHEVRRIDGQRYEGKINKILHNDEKGADGFITFDGTKTIYFRVNSNEELVKTLKLGLEVEFRILPATLDKKEKAIQVRIAKAES